MTMSLFKLILNGTIINAHVLLHAILSAGIRITTLNAFRTHVVDQRVHKYVKYNMASYSLRALPALTSIGYAGK